MSAVATAATRWESGTGERGRTACVTPAVGKLRERCIRGQRNGSGRDECILELLWQDGQQTVGIIQRAVVVVDYLDPAYDPPGVMRAQRTQHRTRPSKREPPAPLVDPEIQPRVAG